MGGYSRFYEFIKAERFLANAVFAMSHKKYPDALQLFQKAADLGSPNGYWGLAHLYRLGPAGVGKTCAWRMNTPENPPCRDLRGLP